MNNSNGLTLTNSVNATNIITMSGGDITTNANILALGSSTASLGTLSRTSGNIVGYFKRWIAATATSNILFPLGATNGTYQGFTYSFTTAPSAGGTITSNLTVANPGKNGFNLYDAGDSIIYVAAQYWTCTTANGLTGGTFSLDMTATNLPNVNSVSDLRIIRRNDSSSPWTMQGVKVDGTGPNSAPIVHRTGMTSHGQFGIGSSSTNTLPITLMYFNAHAINNIVNLSWATASEINNDYFTIERSEDGKNFENLLQKKGAGNSTAKLYYSAADENPFLGTAYYRLKQTDYDGRFTYSTIKSVRYKSINKSPNIEIESIGPNPFNDQLNIHYNVLSEGNMEVQLISNSGQLVFKDAVRVIKGSNSYSFLEGNSLQRGIYIIRLSLNGEHVTKNILKQ